MSTHEERERPVSLPQPSYQETLRAIEEGANNTQDRRVQDGFRRLSEKLTSSKKEADDEKDPATAERKFAQHLGFHHQARVTDRYRQKGKILGVEENQSDRRTWEGNRGKYVSADAVVATNSFPGRPEKIVEVKYRPSAARDPYYEQSTLEELQAQIGKDMEQAGRVKLWWHGELPPEIKKYVQELHQKSEGAFTYQTFD